MITRAAVRALSSKAKKHEVVHDVAKQQFQIPFDNDTAIIVYEQKNSNIIFLTTNVPESFQGKGFGKILAKAAFDYAQRLNLQVTCKCHFLAKYFEDNIQKYKDLKVKMELE